MYNEKIEGLIKAALADGVLTEKEKQILFRKAQEEGIDLDEFEMVLDARLIELQKAQTKQATPQESNKLGSVKKCPACGAIVNSFDGVCAECGFAFDNVQANKSSERLFNLLKSANTEEDKEDIIKTFPLPMAKSDLLEFISKLHAEIFDYNGKLERNWGAYYDKYSECIEKCKISFSEDPKIRHYIDEFVNAGKEVDVDQIATIFIAICSLCGAAAFCIWAYFAECGVGGWIAAFCGGEAVGAIIGVILRPLLVKVVKSR